MNAPDEWDRWRADWRTGPRPSASPPAPGRESRLPVLIEGGLTVLAVAGIMFTLTHTHTARDVAWAVLVVALIAVGWIVELARRRGASALGEATASYIEHTRQQRRRELRAVHIAWGLCAAVLLYLVPWWIEGFRVHGGEPFTTVMVVAFWLPAGLLGALLVWTWRIERTARREIRQLDELARRFGDE